jgi:hypothetical protein
MLFRDAVAAAALADVDRGGFTVDDLHEAFGGIDKKAALTHMRTGGQIDGGSTARELQVKIDWRGFAVVKGFRKKMDGG